MKKIHLPQLKQKTKSKIKLISLWALTGLILVTIFAFLEDRILNLFKGKTSADTKTSAVAATPFAVTGSTVIIVDDDRFAGDQIINLQPGQDYTLSVPLKAKRAEFQVQENPVLLRLGGSPVIGGFLCDVEEVHSLDTREEMLKVVFRTQTGMAKLIVNFWTA